LRLAKADEGRLKMATLLCPEVELFRLEEPETLLPPEEPEPEAPEEPEAPLPPEVALL
jgi:hypothetical protein